MSRSPGGVFVLCLLATAFTPGISEAVCGPLARDCPWTLEEIMNVTGKIGPVHTRVVAMHPRLIDVQATVLDISGQMSDVKEEVHGTGNLKVVADDLREQLRDLVDQGVILQESVEDFLAWLGTRQGPYRTFVGPGSPRCSPSTPCGQFRADLSSFFLEIGDQQVNFPVIERAGLGDGSRAAFIVEDTPPIILFGLYEVLDKVPEWRQMPANLQSIFDEIGDPDVFSVRLQEDEEGAATSAWLTNSAVGEKTPTERFCDRWEKRVDKEMDPVRINRIEFYLFYLRQLLGLVESLTSETIGVTLVGEGNETLIPNPLKAQLKTIEVIFDVVQRAAQTFRDNLGVCRANRRELELQVAECIELVDFILPSKRDKVYVLVQTKVENAAEEFVPVANAERSLAMAERFRLEGKFKQAYLKLCDAYRQIGELR